MIWEFIFFFKKIGEKYIEFVLTVKKIEKIPAWSKKKIGNQKYKLLLLFFKKRKTKIMEWLKMKRGKWDERKQKEKLVIEERGKERKKLSGFYYLLIFTWCLVKENRREGKDILEEMRGSNIILHLTLTHL